MKGQGIYFPEIPAFSTGDQGVLMRDNNSVFKREKTNLYDAKETFTGDMKKYLTKSKDKYSGFKYTFPPALETPEGEPNVVLVKYIP